MFPAMVLDAHPDTSPKTRFSPEFSLFLWLQEPAAAEANHQEVPCQGLEVWDARKG